MSDNLKYPRRSHRTIDGKKYKLSSPSKVRSNTMQKIRSKNTKPEIILRKELWSLGYRYRINVKDLPGSPDIFFKRKRVAIFVDGEFWHGYDWEKNKQKIKSNSEFWIAKIESNMRRDQANNTALRNQGFTVLRFWEKEIRKELDEVTKKITEFL